MRIVCTAWVAFLALASSAVTVLRPVDRAVHRTAGKLWGWTGPWVRDAAGWLAHTAPRVLGRWLRRRLVRLARWLPGALARTLLYALVGLVWSLRHLARYCIGYRDYGGLVRQAAEEDRPRREFTARRNWRRAALRRTTTVLTLGVVLTVVALVAARHYGPPAALGELTGLMAVLAGIGRAVRPRPRSEDPAMSEQDEQGPYPIADAHTRAEAADCVARALTAESISLRMTGEARRTGWGWEVPVILRQGTPAAIVAKTAELETHLDLPAGGLLAAPDATRRARVVLRLALTDPFVRLGTAPDRPPRSATITQRATLGRRIDGDDLTVPLLGVHGVVIGSPGAGKSSTLLALADAVTACADATAWDLDPAGYGLDPLGDAVGRRERDPAGIEHALADALALAEARPKLLRELGMGSAWNPSPERPALVVFVDEYPRLTPAAKETAVQILRVGRKSRVTLLLAATEATSDALGASIADTTALRIMHACRYTDVRLVLGPQMAAEGWRPDRLRPATADDPGDVGKGYVATAGAWEPLIGKVAPVPEDTAAEHGHQRAAAGIPRIDGLSWTRARALRSPDATVPTPREGETAGQPMPASGTGSGVGDVQAVADVLAAFGPDSRAWTEHLLTRLAERDQRYAAWGPEDLAALLRPLGIRPRDVRITGSARKGYYRDEVAVGFAARKGAADR